MLKKRPSKKAIRRVKTRITGSKRVQIHVHEFVGSTKLAEKGQDRHNHRFAGVTGQAIRVGRSHVHEIDLERTDSVDHFHELKKIRTGPAIPVGKGKHVHFVTGQTTLNDGHVHQFNFATLIQSPLIKEKS
ncbi:YmaF family protein [Paenibacillus sp. FSL W8-0919]|uniref:YmaF family protein n=1 Tax=Paenibacillus sp. FSL W8-0919 TaxID=2954707 RepID=UPI0030F681FF